MADRKGTGRLPARAALLCLVAGLLGVPATAADEPAPVRSELYPPDWQPARPDREGRFLHDFSYAGYRYGEPVPSGVDGPVLDVTQPPYGADAGGEEDATAAIQAALDDVGAAGGGTVHLPAGTYRVSPPDDSRAVLHLAHDGVLLRGDGPERTRILNDQAEDMRHRAVILVGPDRSDWVSWHDEAGDSVRLTAAVAEPTRTLHVAQTGPFAVGDWVVLRSDTTDRWLREHPVAADQQWDSGTLEALVYHRRVTAVDPAAGTVEIDIPTRYQMELRDDLRLHRAPAPLAGSGLAGLAVGMRQSDLREEDEEEDHEQSGTRGWQAHQASAVAFNGVVHGWLDDVHSFRPDENDDDVHLLSVGVYVRDSRNITIEGTDLRHPQYRGAGGNGYLYHLMGSDTLVRDARAEGGRHNYLVQAVQATGNVVLDSLAVDGERATELHRHLSVANLFDNLWVDGDTLEMAYRTPSNHAHTTTQSVMWNVSGERCTRGRLALSQQLGWGYVIGTSGSGDCAQVETPGGEGTEPRDWLEHQGQGQRLEPRSLYLDQLERRIARGELPGAASRAPDGTYPAPDRTAPAPSPSPVLDPAGVGPLLPVVVGGVLLAAVAIGVGILVGRRPR